MLGIKEQSEEVRVNINLPANVLEKLKQHHETMIKTMEIANRRNFQAIGAVDRFFEEAEKVLKKHATLLQKEGEGNAV